MPNRSRNTRPRHINQPAAAGVDEATRKPETEDQADTEPRQDQQQQKNAAATELGRLGGLKGGKARSAKLTSERRRQIAKKAAEKRWGKREST